MADGGVKPVHYIKDSTAGVASAGQNVTITRTNANKIYKDYQLTKGGNEIIEYDDAQEKRLMIWQDESDETVTYSSEEQKTVGRGQIDTKGEDGEELSDKGGGNAVAGLSSAANGLGFMLAIAGLIVKGKTMNEVLPGFGQIGIAGMALGLAASSLATTMLFDPDLKERESQTNKADDNIGIIKAHSDLLDQNMQAIEEDRDLLTQLTGAQTAAVVDTLGEVGNLTVQSEILKKQGNFEEAQKIDDQIKSITKEGDENNKASADEIQNVNDNLEQYNFDVNEGLGIHESGTEVEEFLKQGYGMKTWADINMYAAMVCAVGCATVLCMPKLAPFFPDAGASLGAKIMWFASAALFLGSAGILKGTSSKELAAGKKGSDMGTELENLSAYNKGCAAFTEDAEAYYIQTAADAAKAVGDAQQGNKKGIKNGLDQLAGDSEDGQEEDRNEDEVFV